MSFCVLSIAIMMSGIKEEGMSFVVSAPRGRPSMWGNSDWVECYEIWEAIQMLYLGLSFDGNNKRDSMASLG